MNTTVAVIYIDLVVDHYTDSNTKDWIVKWNPKITIDKEKQGSAGARSMGLTGLILHWTSKYFMGWMVFFMPLLSAKTLMVSRTQGYIVFMAAPVWCLFNKDIIIALFDIVIERKN